MCGGGGHFFVISSSARLTFRGLLGFEWNRAFGFQQNAQSYVSKLELRSVVAEDIRSILNASTEVHAKLITASVISKYETSEPRLAEWLVENIQETLAVLQLPVERLNKEIKRRTRFEPGEAVVALGAERVLLCVTIVRGAVNIPVLG